MPPSAVRMGPAHANMDAMRTGASPVVVPSSGRPRLAAAVAAALARGLHEARQEAAEARLGGGAEDRAARRHEELKDEVLVVPPSSQRPAASLGRLQRQAARRTRPAQPCCLLICEEAPRAHAEALFTCGSASNKCVSELAGCGHGGWTQHGRWARRATHLQWRM